jgi:glycosyltransferase involved in cell wall biosynthesis
MLHSRDCDSVMETLRFLFTSSFYPPYHIGGDALHVSYLAEELAKRGHEVHVFYSRDAYKVKKGTARGNEPSSAVVTHPIQTAMAHSAYEAYVFGGSRVVARRFQNVVDEVNPDVVHHHNISLLGYNILKRGCYVNLYTAHDYWLICPSSNLIRGEEVCETASCTLCGLANRRPPQLWRHLTVFEKAIGSIDTLVSPSNYARERITRKVRIKAVTIPNFVPNPPSKIPVSGYTGFCLYAGTLENHKGILQLLAVWRKLLGQFGSKTLLVAGDGGLRGKVQGLIEREKLEGNVSMFGWVDHNRIWSLLRDAWALIVPSMGPENAPLVSLEALSVGTPVVGSNRGGLPEIVSKLDRGLVFSWEEDGLLGSFVTLEANHEKFRKKASQVYQEYFSPESYLASYKQIIS